MFESKQWNIVYHSLGEVHPHDGKGQRQRARWWRGNGLRNEIVVVAVVETIVDQTMDGDVIVVVVVVIFVERVKGQGRSIARRDRQSNSNRKGDRDVEQQRVEVDEAVWNDFHTAAVVDTALVVGVGESVIVENFSAVHKTFLVLVDNHRPPMEEKN
jgi:hypothetical protein